MIKELSGPQLWCCISCVRELNLNAMINHSMYFKNDSERYSADKLGAV